MSLSRKNYPELESEDHLLNRISEDFDELVLSCNSRGKPGVSTVQEFENVFKHYFRVMPELIIPTEPGNIPSIPKFDKDSDELEFYYFGRATGSITDQEIIDAYEYPELVEEFNNSAQKVMALDENYLWVGGDVDTIKVEATRIAKIFFNNKKYLQQRRLRKR